jgi:hypothetical protein
MKVFNTGEGKGGAADLDLSNYSKELVAAALLFLVKRYMELSGSEYLVLDMEEISKVTENGGLTVEISESSDRLRLGFLASNSDKFKEVVSQVAQSNKKRMN